MKKEQKKITKLEAVHLFNVLSAAKSGSLSREARVQLIVLRSKLKQFSNDKDNVIEEVRKSASKEEFNFLANAAIMGWGAEDTTLETRVLGEDDVFALLENNEFVGADEDILYNCLVK